MDTIELTKELSQNFLDFSHEVNYQRAFADARDGLKPGQRACLWEMYEKGYKSNKPHVKSAKISGGVIANWWPHGDTAIYETFARMSQSWINNIPEVDWHGANGSVQISGEPAASRYTEARLSKVVEDGMLLNINKNNVPMKPNFSDDEEWPVVFPAIFPRLAINGCQGIGSTIANVWLPHCFTEIAQAIDNYITNKTIDYTSLAPSFPSGGIIINKKDLQDIYKTGKGKVILRGKAEIKDNLIIITEIPYQVYVEPLIDEIKKYAIEEENSGIESVLNKSSKKIHIEIECSNNPAHVLQQLYKKTNLQKTYNANQYALTENGVPKLLNFEEYLKIYVNHNIDCIIRETKFDLNKAIDRLEIVEGLLKALEDIDNIIALIKQSENAAAAKDNLIAKYQFTENQAKAILAMRLSSLAKLEKVELNKEAEELNNTIKELTNILNSEDKQKDILKNRLSSLVKKYGDARRTELTQIDIKPEDKEIEEVIPEDVVVILSQTGEIKRVPASNFKPQHRNGKGIKSKDEAIMSTISTNTIDNLLLFTKSGKMFKMVVDNIPVGSNTSKGVLVNTLINIDPNDEVIAMTALSRENDARFVVFFTKQGLIKKTYLDEYTTVKRSTGIAAIKLNEGDSIANIEFINDENVLVITKNGMSINFETKTVNAIGRVTAGVKAIKLAEDDEVIVGLPIYNDKTNVAIISTKGYGKITDIKEFTPQGRGGKGLMIYKPTDIFGSIAGAALVKDDDKILLNGSPNSICVAASELPLLSRTSYGNIVLKANISSIVKI